MKMIKSKSLHLSEISAGTIFVYDDDYYVKTNTVDDDEERILSLSLDNWNIYYFRFETPVKILDKENV